MEVTSAGVQRAYVMSNGAVVAQLNPNGSFYWLHLDHLGSGRKMTDSSGNMTYRAEFDPYGKLLYEWSSPTNLNTRKFTGYERDAATNLDYAQARMYSSEWGRFMSPDPARVMNPARPQSFNLYSYTENNPVNRVDPSGLGWVVKGEVTCIIIGGIVKCWTTFQFTWEEGIGAGPNPYYDPRNYLPSVTQGPPSLPTGTPINWIPLIPPSVLPPERHLNQTERSAVLAGIDEARRLLANERCARWISDVIQEAARIDGRDVPKDGMVNGNPIYIAAFDALGRFTDRLNTGRVIASGVSGSNGRLTTQMTTNLGTSIVKVNNEYFQLSRLDQGRHTLHEALHQFRLTDEALALAASGGRGWGRESPSAYFNTQLWENCQ
jgi:RHS repeat-associated protein